MAIKDIIEKYTYKISDTQVPVSIKYIYGQLNEYFDMELSPDDLIDYLLDADVEYMEYIEKGVTRLLFWVRINKQKLMNDNKGSKNVE